MSASMDEIDDFLNGPHVAWVCISLFLFYYDFLCVFCMEHFWFPFYFRSTRCVKCTFGEKVKCPYAAFIYLHTSNPMSRRHYQLYLYTSLMNIYFDMFVAGVESVFSTNTYSFNTLSVSLNTIFCVIKNLGETI